MTMSVNEEDFKDIEAVFRKRDITRDIKRYEELVANSRKESVAQPRVEVRRQGKVKSNDIKKLIINVLLCSSLIVGGYVGINAVMDHINNPTNMNNLSQSIGALALGNDPDFLREFGDVEISILSQNTSNENGVAKFDHAKIAEDLIGLENRDLFDYAFYSLCNDMGTNLNNEIVSSSGVSRTNIGWVINNLKLLSASKDTEFKEYISTKLEGVSNLDEYLIADNYVDSNGNPSLEKAMNAMNLKAEGILKLVESLHETKVVKKW